MKILVQISWVGQSTNFSVNPLIQIVGCQPEASPVMLESVRAGRVVDWDSQETLSGFSMRTLSCWMWWSSGRIMSRLLLIFSWRAKRLSQVFLWWGCCVVVLLHCDKNLSGLIPVRLFQVLVFFLCGGGVLRGWVHGDLVVVLWESQQILSAYSDWGYRFVCGGGGPLVRWWLDSHWSSFGEPGASLRCW